MQCSKWVSSKEVTCFAKRGSRNALDVYWAIFILNSIVKESEMLFLSSIPLSRNQKSLRSSLYSKARQTSVVMLLIFILHSPTCREYGSLKSPYLLKRGNLGLNNNQAAPATFFGGWDIGLEKPLKVIDVVMDVKTDHLWDPNYSFNNVFKLYSVC